MTTPKIQLAIKAGKEEIWTALTDGATTPTYYYGFRADFDLSPGSPYRYTAGGGDMITGTVVEVEPERLLKTTFNGLWDPSIAELPESTVIFTLSDPPMPAPGVTFLSCVHEGLPEGAAVGNLELGWVSILSGLKTLLETGSPLVATPSS